MIKLTPRESQVYELAKDGLTIDQIVELMGVTPMCVATHVSHARKKILDARLPWPSISRRVKVKS